MNAIGIVLGLCVAILACASPPPGFSEASVRHGCSQEDAPAMEIYLTRVRFDGGSVPPRPFIRLEIAGRNQAAMLGKAIDLAPLSRAGRDPALPLARAEFHGEGSAHEWLRGKITLRSVEASRAVEGTYELKGSGEQVWKGTFRARWIASAGGCG